MSAHKLVLVTGPNRGIGYFICKHLLLGGHQLVLAARSLKSGEETVSRLLQEPDIAQKLAPESVRANVVGIVEADLENDATIQHLPAAVQALLPRNHRLDVLINNAGFAFRTDATEPVSIQAKKSVTINYFGTLKVTEALLPLIADGGRIVHVGSRAGMLSIIPSAELRHRLLANDLTTAQLTSILSEFVESAQRPEHASLKKWPTTNYGMSKVGVDMLAFTMARDPRYAARGITVNSCCPGWCRTDMGGDGAPKSAEDGADTPVWVAVDPALAGVTGKFFADRQEVDYFKA